MTLSELTLYGAVKRAAEKFPRKVALLYMGRNIRYGRLIREIDRAADMLAGEGITAGTPITICMPNIPECVVLFYAANKLGAVAHMVHPLAPEAALGKYIKSVGSTFLAVTDIFAQNYAGLIGGGEIKTLLCSPAGMLGAVKRAAFAVANRSKVAPVRRIGGVLVYSRAIKRGAKAAIKSGAKAAIKSDENAPAVYLHSGGTSGDPKTIILSSKAINALCEQGYDILGLSSLSQFHGGGMLAVLPMFHGFGLAMGVHVMLCHGGTDVLIPKFHTAETIKLIAKNKLNYLIGVPVLYEALLSKPKFSGKKLKNIRQAFVGGDYVPKNLMARFDERMRENGGTARLFEGYGLTETVTVCSVNKSQANRAGSVGKAVIGMEIAAFDGETKLPAGSEGELCVAGDELMTGYYGDESGDVFFESGGKRFVRTGDLGHVDEDGYVFFHSRIKRVAKVNGVPVFPSEIEKLVMDCRAEVREACAVAVPDERTGAKIRLFAVLKSPAETGAAEEERALMDFIERELGGYSRPDRVVFVDGLPKTLVGKVDVNALLRSQSEK